MTSAAAFIDFSTCVSWIDWTGVGLSEVAPFRNYSNQQLGQSYQRRENCLLWRHLMHKKQLSNFHWADSRFRPGPACPERSKRCWLYGNPLVSKANQQHWRFGFPRLMPVNELRVAVVAHEHRGIKIWLSNPGFHLNTNTSCKFLVKDKVLIISAAS